MSRIRGFTLIEMLVVVAIIGILSAIAIPNYSAYILKSNRSAAITGVLDLASRQARIYTLENKYKTSMTDLGYATDPMPIGNAAAPTYNLSVLSASAAGFVVQAVPVGKQAGDVCGTFKYDDLGKKTMSGGTSAGTVKECWKQ